MQRRLRDVTVWLGHIGAVVAIGTVDYALGADIQLSAIYLVPILTAALWFGRALSVVVAILAAVAWYWNTDLVRPTTASLAVAAWNGVSRLVIYLALALVMDQLRRERAKAQRLAVTDDLTGLANARALRERLSEDIARATRYGRAIGLLLVDCDDLKRINDRFGHGDGNRVLHEVGRAIARTVRTPDLAARWGGDEFAVLQDESSDTAARLLAQRIKASVDALRITLGAGEAVPVTVSIGIALYPTVATDDESLFRAADRALYDAKRAGKDRAVMAG